MGLNSAIQQSIVIGLRSLEYRGVRTIGFSKKKLPIEPVDCRQFLTRASLALIIGAGVAWGLNEWVDWDAFSSDVERQMIEMIRQVHRGVGLTNY